MTSGLVLLTGSVHPGLATGAGPAPGLSSMNMSLRPVLGRNSAVALVWIRCLYLSSICICTTAAPLRKVTPPISPICTPDTRTDWPWPGVTAWAVENSALIVNGLDWMNGKRKRSWLRM